MHTSRFTPVLSIAGLILLWIVAASLAADPQLLPQPWDLLPRFRQEIASGELFRNLGATCLRVIWAFSLAMTIGTVIGFSMGRFPAVNRWLDPWLVVFLNLPALVVIVLCYLWIGLTEAAAIIAVTLNKIPNVSTILREGGRALDPDLDAMATIYRMPAHTRVRHVILPQLAPFLAAAARSGLSLIWKIVLVVEFLGRSSGVGFQIHLYFQLFDVAMVLVYAFSFILIMLLVEWLLLQPLERSARRWRTA